MSNEVPESFAEMWKTATPEQKKAAWAVMRGNPVVFRVNTGRATLRGTRRSTGPVRYHESDIGEEPFLIPRFIPADEPGFVKESGEYYGAYDGAIAIDERWLMRQFLAAKNGARSAAIAAIEGRAVAFGLKLPISVVAGCQNTSFIECVIDCQGGPIQF